MWKLDIKLEWWKVRASRISLNIKIKRWTLIIGGEKEVQKQEKSPEKKKIPSWCLNMRLGLKRHEDKPKCAYVAGYLVWFLSYFDKWINLFKKILFL